MKAVAEYSGAGAAVQTELSYRPVFLLAVAMILSLFVSVAGWGMYARLDSAVVTHGVLLAESRKKTVEQLEGGILEALLVKAGDRVEQGQIVALLDATQIREQMGQLETARIAFIFDIWRLVAEETGQQRLDRSGAPGIPGDARDWEIDSQTRHFEARKRSHDGQVGALRRRIEQLRAQSAASEGQANAAEKQLEIWAEEQALTQSLVEKGTTPKQKLMEFARTIAILEGNRDEHRGLMAATAEEIARAEIDIETLEQMRLVEISERLATARRGLEAVTSEIRATADILERRKMRAPQAGLVVNIQTVTPGAIIRSGAPLMEIVPDGDPLVAEVRLPPDAIDTVHVGRSAQVRLTAYRRAQSPLIDGEVTYVSADLLEDERDGSIYFSARVSLDLSALEAMPDVLVTSGMPVEVSIRTGERRAGDYFLEPVLRHFRRALREE